MADETITNPDSTQSTDTKQTNPSQERIRELSDKVELTAKERDEAKSLNETVTRERDFFKGFSEVVATHQAAKDHQEEIKEKVLKGYTVEDATLAVLGKAGKLGQVQTQTTVETPAGGSAATNVTQNTQKTPSEMTQAERRAILEKELLMS